MSLVGFSAVATITLLLCVNIPVLLARVGSGAADRREVGGRAATHVTAEYRDCARVWSN